MNQLHAFIGPMRGPVTYGHKSPVYDIVMSWSMAGTLCYPVPRGPLVSIQRTKQQLKLIKLHFKPFKLLQICLHEFWAIVRNGFI